MGWGSRAKERGPSVFIGIPTMGMMHQRLAMLLVRLAETHRNGLYIKTVQDAIPVDYARNILVDQFLQTNAQWLLMIDSDVCPPDSVLNLTKHEDAKVVGGVCFGLIGGQCAVTIFEADPSHPGQYRQSVNVNQDGLVEVDATGTGCIAIHRDVIEAIKPPRFEFIFDPLTRKIRVGEDIRFCEKAKEVGYKVFIDKSVVCGHYKQVDLTWVNNQIVSYMSPEKVELLVDQAIQRRVSHLESMASSNQLPNVSGHDRAEMGANKEVVSVG